MRKRFRRLFRNAPPSATTLEARDWFDISQLPDRVRPAVEANMLALGEYVPKPYPGRIMLFRARTRPLFHAFRSDLGWSRFAAAGVHVKTVPGNHETMLQEPFVRILAEQLQAALDRSE
jgi:thioesterase domain-containing protein